ncbi:MAG: hypothetical protein KatS3mg016_0475 [Fimbriimonadales bacterium]|nr:MAG: hypothetical protein KatS3mg016_0475 [Fimbriimonadales bacterium]
MQPDYASPGFYRAGRRHVTVRRPNNTTFNAQLYYPATATGDNAPYDGSGAPYPAVSFGHGFLQPPERYRSTLEHLATWGYFVIATESGLEIFPNHRTYSEDMRHCLTYLEQQNADSSSPLFRQVATEQFGISGHSMGGGASILAAAADTRIRTEARPATTPVVAPDGSALVLVAVWAPRGRRPAQDVARVRALSLRDGGTLATAFIRTVYG